MALPFSIDLIDALSFQQPLFKDSLILGFDALELDTGTRIGVRINDPATRLESSLASRNPDGYRGSLRQRIRHFDVAAI